MFVKYLPRNAGLASSTNTNASNNIKSSSSSSSSSSVSSSNASLPLYASAQTFNKSHKFNGINVSANTGSSDYSYKMTKSENLINNIMHTTAKSGKISKRKSEKNPNINLGSVQCYNLNEKEKFRQLIAQNCQQTNKFNTNRNVFPPAASFSDSRNAYRQFIHSSPTKTRDDNTFDSKCQPSMYRNELNLPVSNLTLPSLNPTLKVSTGYTRRISCSHETKPFELNRLQSTSVLKNSSNNLFNKSNSINSFSNNNNNNNNNKAKVEVIDISSSSTPVIQNRTSVVKLAQKRPSTQQLDENMNESTSVTSIDNLKKETKDYYEYHNGQNMRSTNRQPNSVELSINERLNKNFLVLDSISNKPINKLNAVKIEEEHYKLKKRQRLEKDKIEKELAAKFSQQLYLDTDKLVSAYLQEEKEPEIEDEFPELTCEKEQLINNALNVNPQDEVLSNAFNISITRKDIQTLKGLNWLNDEIINFYMSLIAERSKESDIKIHTFTTFFYPKLLKDGFQSLKRWTRKIDIFSFDLVLVPIHLGLHWTLAVIDLLCKEIRYYDSMNGNNHECLKALKLYLKEEHADKKGNLPLDLSSWNCIHVKDIPQQMNGSDCGMFACKYAEFASRGKNVFNFNQSHMPYFRRRMIWEIINKKLM